MRNICAVAEVSPAGSVEVVSLVATMTGTLVTFEGRGAAVATVPDDDDDDGTIAFKVIAGTGALVLDCVPIEGEFTKLVNEGTDIGNLARTAVAVAAAAAAGLCDKVARELVAVVVATTTTDSVASETKDEDEDEVEEEEEEEERAPKKVPPSDKLANIALERALPRSRTGRAGALPVLDMTGRLDRELARIIDVGTGGSGAIGAASKLANVVSPAKSASAVDDIDNDKAEAEEEEDEEEAVAAEADIVWFKLVSIVPKTTTKQAKQDKKKKEKEKTTTTTAAATNESKGVAV